MPRDIRAVVEKYSSIPGERLRVLSCFEDVQLTEIRRGVIFVLATWSVPAVLGLKKFTSATASLDTRSVELIVLDIDYLSNDAAAQLFGTDGFPAGGNGETIWVCNGQIVAREIAALVSEDVLRQHTQRLLHDEFA